MAKQQKTDVKLDVEPQLVKALESVKERFSKYGEWDEGCFYYNRYAASELHEPIRLINEALNAYYSKGDK